VGKFVKGDVVVIPFPFSDLSNSKRRPALVIAKLKGDDVILCQITSQARMDGYNIQLTAADFSSGSLPLVSNIRPSMLFTGNTETILKKAGNLKQSKINEVIQKLKEIIDS